MDKHGAEHDQGDREIHPTGQLKTESKQIAPNQRKKGKAREDSTIRRHDGGIDFEEEKGVLQGDRSPSRRS